MARLVQRQIDRRHQEQQPHREHRPAISALAVERIALLLFDPSQDGGDFVAVAALGLEPAAVTRVARVVAGRARRDRTHPRSSTTRRRLRRLTGEDAVEWRDWRDSITSSRASRKEVTIAVLGGRPKDAVRAAQQRRHGAARRRRRTGRDRSRECAAVRAASREGRRDRAPAPVQRQRRGVAERRACWSSISKIVCCAGIGDSKR